MKKSLLILGLAVVIALSGCNKEETKEAQNETVAQGETSKDNETVTDAETSQDEEAAATKEASTNDETDDKDAESVDLEEYIASVEKKAKSINDYIENDAMTQDDMNTKSKELYDLWDEALNTVWKEIEKELSVDEFAKLKDEQLKWVSDKEDKIKDAGKEYEGGSMYALTVNSEGAKLTEERVKELYKKIKQ